MKIERVEYEAQFQHGQGDWYFDSKSWNLAHMIKKLAAFRENDEKLEFSTRNWRLVKRTVTEEVINEN